MRVVVEVERGESDWGERGGWVGLVWFGSLRSLDEF